MPRIDSSLVYMEYVAGRGSELFEAVCASDLEGVAAKWKHNRYHSDRGAL
jgi:ATP-dependent DNA ligase